MAPKIASLAVTLPPRESMSKTTARMLGSLPAARKDRSAAPVFRDRALVGDFGASSTMRPRSEMSAQFGHLCLPEIRASQIHVKCNTYRKVLDSVQALWESCKVRPHTVNMSNYIIAVMKSLHTNAVDTGEAAW